MARYSRVLEVPNQVHLLNDRVVAFFLLVLGVWFLNGRVQLVIDDADHALAILMGARQIYG